MEDKLEKEKDGMLISKRLQHRTLDSDTSNFFDRSVEELSVPDFKRNHSTDMIRRQAAETASSSILDTIKRMVFTFRPTFVALQLSCQETGHKVIG